MDSYEGDQNDPLSLNKYLYVGANPVNGIDPSGNMQLSTVITAVSIGFAVHSLYTVYKKPTAWNIGMAAFNIATLPISWVKGLAALGLGTSAVKGFISSLNFLKGTEKATRAWLAAKEGVEVLGRGEQVVEHVLAVGQQAKKACDFVAYNSGTAKYILTEAKTTLQAKHLVDLEQKVEFTYQAIQKIEQAGSGTVAALEEISITYSSLKASGLGPYSIDAAGYVLKNGEPLVIKGLKVIAVKVAP